MTLVVSRRAISKAALLIAAMTVTGSVALANKASPDGLFDIEWRVTDLAGAEPIADHVPTLILSETGQAGGNTGCNVYFSTATINESAISFTQVGTTYIACEEAVMVQERAFLEALELTARFQLTADGLELIDRDGALLVKLAAST